jgi:adenylate cyclase class 2
MTSRPAHRETEIKLAVLSARAARDLLLAHGFHVARPRVLEVNLVLDTEDSALRASRRLLRLRRAGSRHTVTYKGPPLPGRHKSREELEFSVAGARLAESMFDALGYQSAFRYEKHRTEYRRTRNGLVTLDETPIGVFLELEGPPRWIDRTARELGFAASDAITKSYGSLFSVWRRRKGVTPAHMVF